MESLWLARGPLKSPPYGGSATVTKKFIAHAVGNNGEAFVDRPGREVFAPMDFAIRCGLEGDHQVHLPSSDLMGEESMA